MADEKKSRKGCIIALVIVGIIAVVVMIGVNLFYQKVKGFGEDYLGVIGASPKMIEQVKELNHDFPFEEPEDGTVTEDQITRFIDIKQSFVDRIKDHEEEFKKLDEAKAQGESGFQEFRQAIKVLSDLRRDFLTALSEHKMSPKEYRFLSLQIYTSYLGLALQGLESNIKYSTELNQENIALLNRYQDELKELNTSGFEFWGVTLWGDME